MGQPQISSTDQHGYFAIAVPITSHRLRWWTYPYKESQYSPELVAGAHSYDTDENHSEVVQLDEAEPEANIQLRLGRKAGGLKLTACDAATGVSLTSVVVRTHVGTRR